MNKKILIIICILGLILISGCVTETNNWTYYNKCINGCKSWGSEDNNVYHEGVKVSGRADCISECNNLLLELKGKI